MLVALNLMLAVLLLLAGYMLWQRARQTAEMARLQEQLQVIEADLEPESANAPLSEPEMVLTIRLRDPLTLARRESRAARLLADHLPTLVRQKVYEQVQKEIGGELAEREIEADLKVEFR
ncbi:hypothetical protein QQM79_06395 [Marinobacteraceae bacterium S3BR75-40.1]